LGAKKNKKQKSVTKSQYFLSQPYLSKSKIITRKLVQKPIKLPPHKIIFSVNILQKNEIYVKKPTFLLFFYRFLTVYLTKNVFFLAALFDFGDLPITQNYI
jgi:hypothetical protein